MKNKTISRNVKRRLTFFGPIISIILIFCVASICSYAYKIYSLKKEEIDLRNKLVELKQQENNLNDEITKLKDPDYIAKYAREKYYYTKDGEYVIKVTEDKKETAVSSKNGGVNRAYYVISLVLLVLILLIVIFKKKKKRDI